MDRDTALCALDPTSPALISLASRGHLIVTDGRVAVAWPGDGPADTSHDRTRSGITPAGDVLDSTLWPATTTETPLDLAALRAWLETVVPPEPGPPPPPGPDVPCKRCKGRGVRRVVCHCGHDHEHDCDECDGSGKVEPEAPPEPQTPEVRVRGALLDGWILRRLVAALPGDVATWYWEGTPASDPYAVSPVVLAGDGWRAVTMPRRNYDGREPLAVWP